MKSFKHNISLRSKLKSDNVLEVVVVDHDDQVEYYYLINFKRDSISGSSKKRKSKLDQPAAQDSLDESESKKKEEVSSDDKDS